MPSPASRNKGGKRRSSSSGGTKGGIATEIGEKPSDFIALISRLSAVKARCAQFEQLIGSRKVIASAFLANKEKNRFPVPILDKKRVKLSSKAEGDTDYIAATYASFNREDYIITQAPTKENAVDFWRMVWQDGCRIIACVVESSELSETDESKCYQYWPTKPDSSIEIANGRFVLKLNKKKEEKGFTVYDIKMTANSEADINIIKSAIMEGSPENEADKDHQDEIIQPRSVILMHFTEWSLNRWPDIDRIGAFVYALSNKELAVMKKITDDYVPPVIIQGYQGLNRSCALWVCTIMMKQIERKECFDVEFIARNLLRSRIGAFQDRMTFFVMFATAYRVASIGSWISLEEARARIKEIKSSAIRR